MNIHTLFTGVANTHIIENSRGVIVVDAGMPHQARRILDKIRALGLSEKDVRLILITHGHIDHAGSAVALKRLTGAPIALHRDDVPLVATPSLKIPPGRNRFINSTKWLMDNLGWLAPIETFAPDVVLEDGASLHEFGLDARVMHTPGHTAGSVTILCDDGAAFVGDAILNLLRVSFPLYWDDPRAALDSACRIQAAQPRILYSGHGRPFDARALDEFVGAHCGNWKLEVRN
ncbi:MAG: MBL fold metallo-hydrolase [Chloroflexi bacterium]|nr:MBL fold metallo-hydrolase [Chloroflexota bacterium]